MWSLISFLLTDTDSFEYLFLNSRYSRLGPKTSKNTGKTHCREFFGSQNLKTQKHVQQRIGLLHFPGANFQVFK